MTIPAIEVKALGAAYGKSRVFDTLDLEVQQGQMFTLLGPNGCGKTTLLNCILGLHKPQSGRVFVDGLAIENLSPSEMAKKIAYVPQSHKKAFLFTVREMVLMGRAPYTPSYSSPKAADVEIAEEALEAIGIQHLGDRPYAQLSGGEGQLVLLARALAQQSPVVVLDEPTSHLDSYNELLVLDRLGELVEKKNLTVIMTTHYPNQVLYLVNKGLPVFGALMREGKFLALGAGEELICAENISALYKVRSKLLESVDEKGRTIKQICFLGLGEGENES